METVGQVRICVAQVHGRIDDAVAPISITSTFWNILECVDHVTYIQRA
jgi:hypothetical protein